MERARPVYLRKTFPASSASSIGRTGPSLELTRDQSHGEEVCPFILLASSNIRVALNSFLWEAV